MDSDELSPKVEYFVMMSSSDSGVGNEQKEGSKEVAASAGGAPVTGPGGKPMSKSQLKKLKKMKAKGPKKEKPKWNVAGSGKNKKKQKVPEKAAVKFVNTTPPGEKKIMQEEMEQAYNPEAVEAAWDAWWDKQGYYTPDVEAAKAAAPEDKFVMVIPPPNVTGNLHLGHALTITIEDALARWHRMSGRHVLWVPGTDHAGIATQAVVEKRLWKSEQKTRHDLGREKFLERVWAYKNEKNGIIGNQTRRLGASVDHSRAVFTMDEVRSKAVTAAFVKMYDMGLIYRKTRLVNWSHALNTAISDIEVDNEELEGRTLMSVVGHDPKKQYEFGTLTSFAYKIADDNGNATDDEVVVATTRLETMLGDTGIAVHPDDERYKHLHGKKAVHPFNDRLIPLVLDPVLVDMAFGTGAVKITPAHDANDFECGERHKLPLISILNDDGTINSEGGKFEGMMRYDARIAIEEEMKKLGLYRDKKDNKMVIPICSRSGDVIEPRLKPQWWVDTKEMAARAVDTVKNKKLKLVPPSHEAVWYRWLEDPHQWCISRQLWWGHRIPAYLVVIKGGPRPDTDDENCWVIGSSEADARAKAAKKFGVAESEITLEQDPDVLDTWFSSGLFPFSVLGWPEQTDDMAAFFPGSLLETGKDILFFWVARMVMMSLTLTNQLPFHTVYLHTMIRDKYGRKMSKSLGNVIDPLFVIEGIDLESLHETLRQGNLPEKEIKKAIQGQKLDFPDGIPQCGADALRYGLLSYTVQGRDVNLDINRVAKERRFCNKLWQVTRFCLLMTGKDLEPIPDFINKVKNNKCNLALRDKWILSHLGALVKACDAGMKSYRFADITSALSEFWLEKLCNVYVEAIKPVFRVKEPTKEEQELIHVAKVTLWTCLDLGLKLMHPVMPFVTEELWQRLPGRGKDAPESIVVAKYPSPSDVDGLEFTDAIEAFQVANKVAHAMRSLKQDFQLLQKKDIQFYVVTDVNETRNMLQELVSDMQVLGSGKVAILGEKEEKPAGCAASIIDGHLQVLIMLRGVLDVASQLKKLEKDLTATKKSLQSTQAKLSSQRFLDNAKPEVLSETKQKSLDLTAKVTSIEERIQEFKSL